MQMIVHVAAYRQVRDGETVRVSQHTRGGPDRAWVGQSNQSFRERIATLERSGEHPDHGYGQANRESSARGRYQLLSGSLVAAGWKDSRTGEWTARAREQGVDSEAAFLASPRAQEVAMTDFMRETERQLIAKGTLRHVGKRYVGPDGLPVPVTAAGLAGAAHREGAGGTSSALRKLERKPNGRRVNFTPSEKRAIRRMRDLSDEPYEFGRW
jgi:hypothetical protein